MENFASNAQVHEYSLRGVLTLFLVCFSLFLYSQPTLSSSNKKALKLYDKAEKKVKERDFESAIALFDAATQLDHSFYEAFLRKGSLYNALGNEDSVYSNFIQYAKLSPTPAASVLERLAFMAFDRGNYQKSKEYLEGFFGKIPERKKERAINLLERSIPFALSQLENPMEIKIEELPNEINKYGLQYLPTMTVDQKTLIYTQRDEFSSDENIVVSYNSDGAWSSAESISDKINTRSNEGASTISADGRIMIFTACDRRDSYGSCDLYITYKSGDTWSRPKNLGKSVNSKYWESQPSLSADGKTLFFASNRPGGYGGRDLWVTTKKDKTWESPENLGGVVNSFKDETTPFIHFNGQTLFFSSNSYPGMGGFDLFSVEKIDSIWSKPKNLGYPLNTSRDEVALLVSSDGAKGFFAKEIQKNREILDSKIVQFDFPESIKPTQSYYLSGRVVDKRTSAPLRASLQIVDLTKNEILYDNFSDSISGEFYLVLPSESELAGYVKKKGYLYEDFRFDSKSINLFNVDTLEIELTPVDVGKSLILKNIYFSTNSYELDQRSASEIQNVLELLNENPEVEIEISGHTDNIGSADYNNMLSEKRAFSVYSSLIENGISKNRLKYKGYGDAKPIKPNDTNENRQSNRRIEFRVLRTKL